MYLGGNGSVLSLRTVTTTYLNCRREQSSLPGCLVEFDHLERQCAEGRIGKWDEGKWQVCVCVCVCSRARTCVYMCVYVSFTGVYSYNCVSVMWCVCILSLLLCSLCCVM